MRVRVVVMRRGGVKLPLEELRAAKGTVGHLRVSPIEAVLLALPGGPITVLPYLIDPQLRRLRGEEFVLIGTEVVPGGLVNERWPQAWWCTLAA